MRQSVVVVWSDFVLVRCYFYMAWLQIESKRAASAEVQLLVRLSPVSGLVRMLLQVGQFHNLVHCG